MISKKLRLCLSLPALAIATACASTQADFPNSAFSASDDVSGLNSSASASIGAGWISQPPNRPIDVSRQTSQTIPVASGTAMGIGPSDLAPAGLLEFCDRLTAECGVRHQYYTREPQSGFVLISTGRDIVTVRSAPARPIGALAWTSTNRRLVGAINRQVNRSMIGTTDAQAFGRYEYWAMPISNPERTRTKGRPLADCEDFALEKRRALISAGIPEESLYLAVAFTSGTGMHAVLVVATDNGDIVLDNLNDWLTPWSRTGYVWIKRQSTTSLLDWAIAGRATSPVNMLDEGSRYLQIEPDNARMPTRQLADNLAALPHQSGLAKSNVVAQTATTASQTQSATRFGLRGPVVMVVDSSIYRAVGQEEATSNVALNDKSGLSSAQVPVAGVRRPFSQPSVKISEARVQSKRPKNANQSLAYTQFRTIRGAQKASLVFEGMTHTARLESLATLPSLTLSSKLALGKASGSSVQNAPLSVAFEMKLKTLD